MKQGFWIFVGILLGQFLSAQQNSIDSLHQLLGAAKDDTTRINLLNRLSGAYKNSRPDSALFYANDALESSLNGGYHRGEAIAHRQLADILESTGNYPKALENALEGLKKSEVLGDKRLIANCLNSLGGLYSAQGDQKQAMEHISKAKVLVEELRDEKFLSTLLINLGYGYGQMHQLDSARVYLNQALNISLRLLDSTRISISYMNLGMVHAMMKQYDVAVSYYRLAIPYFKASNNVKFLSNTYLAFAEAFDSTNQRDSAFYYGRLTYDKAKEMNYIEVLLLSAKQLASLFKKSGQFDSAFIYKEAAMNINDSVTSQEKRKQIQTLAFAEQLRQMDIAKQQKQKADARKRNLELAGIAIFIPLFLFAVLLLGRRKVKSRTVEFLGVLALLFLFEFIVLFAHPYIGHWTHESPVWMLLILVAVAAVLIPLHHRSEAWIKKKLATLKA